MFATYDGIRFDLIKEDPAGFDPSHALYVVSFLYSKNI